MHHVLRANEVRLNPAYAGHSEHFARCSFIDGTTGSVHIGLGLCSLKPAGQIDTHLHSFEETFYVLEGEPVLILDGSAYPLLPGACGLIPLGVSHAWLGPKSGTAKASKECGHARRPDGLRQCRMWLAP